MYEWFQSDGISYSWMMIIVNVAILASVLALSALSISTSIPKGPRIFLDLKSSVAGEQFFFL